MTNDIKNVLLNLNISLDDVVPTIGENNKYYYTYIIIPTNKASSLYLCVYFGKHITHNIINDKYAGSGTKISNYHAKYPGEYYKRYLGFYNNSTELEQAEYDLIHDHLNKEYCLNLKDGGGNAPLSEETKQKISEKLKNNIISEETKQKISNTMKSKVDDEYRKRMSKITTGKNNPMYGKCSEDYMTPEAIKEKRKKQSENLKGERNGMYGIHVEDLMTPEAIKEKRRKQSNSMKGKNTWIKGKKHVYNEKEHILVLPEEIDKYLSMGYKLGIPKKNK